MLCTFALQSHAGNKNTKVMVDYKTLEKHAQSEEALKQKEAEAEHKEKQELSKF
jgi:hypothetical protein